MVAEEAPKDTVDLTSTEAVPLEVTAADDAPNEVTFL